jgi:hypothetical protein
LRAIRICGAVQRRRGFDAAAKFARIYSGEAELQALARHFAARVAAERKDVHVARSGGAGDRFGVEASESFYEAPNGVHQVSANASDRAPAKFLAYFVCDHEAPLSSDVPEGKNAGEHQ